MARGRMVENTCQVCKNKFTVRVADVNRGWGIFCSKSCKAKSTVKPGSWWVPEESEYDPFESTHCQDEDVSFR